MSILLTWKRFTVITDHKPLLGIYNKNLLDLNNPCLQRMREKVMGYNFQLEWIAGKTNLIADALSCTPKFTNNSDKETNISHRCFIDSSNIPINLKEVADNANHTYKDLVASISNSDKHIPPTEAAQQFHKDFHKLSISNKIPNLILIDSSKIVIPNNYVNKILKRLH